MSITTISTTLQTAVTLGTGNYGSTLTISNTAAIEPQSLVTAAILAGSLVSSASVVNDGVITTNQFSMGIDLKAPGYIDSAGSISVGFDGIYAYTGGQIVNSGHVYGGFNGVFVGYNSSLANTGTISSAEDGISALATSAITNSGLIYGTQIGADLGTDDTLVNNGSINGSYAGVMLGWNDTLENTGIINNAPGLALSRGIFGGKNDNIYNTGTIYGAGTAIDLFDGGNVTNAGTIIGGAEAIDATGNFTLTVDPGAVFVRGVVDNSNNGVLNLAGNTSGTLTGISAFFVNVGSDRYHGFSTVNFDQGSDWSIAGDMSGLASGQSITGFTQSDTIDLTDFQATSETYVAGTGLELFNGATSETLNITGSFNPSELSISPDNGNGTEIVACYVLGTKITTTRRGKIAVEKLKIGDEVQTLHLGPQKIKWIGTRSFSARFASGNHLMLPVRIKRHAFGLNTPSRDLFVSPGHGMYLNGHLVPAWRLINGATITQPPSPEIITYFHIELEHHAVILAENCPAETFLAEGSRNQFHNADEFLHLYPEQEAEKSSSLPRLEDGLLLQAIQYGLSRRAGIAEQKPVQGLLRGYLDQAGPDKICGWAQDIFALEVPVTLDILIGNRHVATILANRYRADLRKAGLGSGCHGFEYTLPARMTGNVTVCRMQDGAGLMKTGASRDAEATRASAHIGKQGVG
jgi:hypothetical protein